MTNDQASFMLSFLLPDVEEEAKITRRVIAAIPAGKGDYAPDPVSRKAIDLAWHLAASEIWFLDSMAKGAFAPDEIPLPPDVKASADVVAWYDRRLPAGIQKVKAITPEKLAGAVDFFGMVQLPLVMYLSFLVKHSVHHRGQLSAYLRPMGAKVPNIYGGSADEPMELLASA